MAPLNVESETLPLYICVKMVFQNDAFRIVSFEPPYGTRRIYTARFTVSRSGW